MVDKEIHIASTRVLRPESKSLSSCFMFHDFDFLNFRFENNFLSPRIKNDLAQHPAVFTSAQALKAWAASAQPAGYSCYCISGKTQAKAEELGFKILGAANDGASLAQVIIAQKPKKVIHFCGNIIRNELKQALTLANIQVEEVVIYHKSPSPQKIEKFNGVLFFSPSQVDAFLQANELPAKTPAFCIGATTAAHVKKLGHANLIVSNKPEELALMQLVVQYFDK